MEPLGVAGLAPFVEREVKNVTELLVLDRSGISVGSVASAVYSPGASGEAVTLHACPTGSAIGSATVRIRGFGSSRLPPGAESSHGTGRRSRG